MWLKLAPILIGGCLLLTTQHPNLSATFRFCLAALHALFPLRGLGALIENHQKALGQIQPLQIALDLRQTLFFRIRAGIPPDFDLDGDGKRCLACGERQFKELR